jgi:hypothetical protein
MECIDMQSDSNVKKPWENSLSGTKSEKQAATGLNQIAKLEGSRCEIGVQRGQEKNGRWCREQSGSRLRPQWRV